MIRCPTNLTSVSRSLSLSLLSKYKSSLRASFHKSFQLLIVVLNCIFVRVTPPYTNMSSAILKTPGSPYSAWSCRGWYFSGTVEIPNGILNRLYRTNGVLNVVSIELSVSSSTCQNQFPASKILNTFAREKFGSIHAIVGSG